jgi:signal transduction histidine kinase
LTDAGIVLLDAARRPRFVSPTAARLLGWSLANPDDGSLGSQLEAALEGAGTDLSAPRVLRVHSAAGRDLHIEVTPIDGGSAGYALLVHDQEALARLESDRSLAAQLRGLALVHRALGHDIRDTLAAVVVQIELLDAALPAASGVEDVPRRSVRLLRGELRRLTAKLELLLAHAQPPDLHAEAFDLRDLLGDVEGMLAPYCRQQRVELLIERPEVALHHRGRRDELRQAAMNLGINALESMPRGGRLRFRLEADSTMASLSVYDSGSGIAPEMYERVFEPNFTTKTNGTGTGLTVARAIVRSHGGEIRLSSEPGQGSCFRIELPLAVGS